MKRTRFYLLCLIAVTGLIASAIAPTMSNRIITGRENNETILVTTSQLLHPWGQLTRMAGRPVDLAIDSNRRRLAVLNEERIDIVDSASGTILDTAKISTTSYAGVAFRPGDKELWASETQRNIGEVHQGGDAVLIATLASNGKIGELHRIPFQGHAVPVGIGFSRDGSRAYVALNRNNTLAVIDTNNRQVLRAIPVGMAPFGVIVADQVQRVFVANRGGRRAAAGEATAPSSGSQIITDPISGSTATGTVSVVSTEDNSVREIPVGLAPSLAALSPDQSTVVVANAHSDSLSFIDVRSLATAQVHIPTWPDSTIGSQPIGAAFSPDGRRLYVACAGNNAVAVLEKRGSDWSIIGAFPTAWFPSAIAVDEQGSLYVANIKGLGNTAVGDGSYRSTHWEGALEKISSPTEAQIAAGAREVQALNEPKYEPAGGIANLSSLGIEHVVFIIKENRTYDQVFGDLHQANGDPRFLQYGRDITPNAHALAEKYVLLDNFYTSGAISFDGHQWLMMAFVSDYTERSFAAYPRGYAWEMGDALTVAPTGFFWQGSPKPLGVRVYGEFCVAPEVDTHKENMVDMTESHNERTWTDNYKLYREGRLPQGQYCQSGVPALASVVDKNYPHAMTITDQAKVDEFFRELDKYEENGKMPNLVVMTLNNDHTQGTRPGSPTPRAMVADNDLALGRVVERLSKSKFWSKTLVLVTEDDSQAGLDHVDGHRTIGLVIGPHVRRRAVDSTNYNHMSMVRTIQEIFGIPARTRFAKGARAMHSVFTADADLGMFKHVTPSVPLDEMNPPVSALDGRKRWAAQQSLAMDFGDVDRVPSVILNEILWWDSHGYDKPYPQSPHAGNTELHSVR
jgi:YVTN family beta-propeller protein